MKVRLFFTIFLASLLAISQACGSEPETWKVVVPPVPNPDTPVDPESPEGYVPERQIRLIAIAKPIQGGVWMATKEFGLKNDYNAQDILEMIDYLKPTTLERFFTGRINMTKKVPVRDGYPDMTYKEFINEALRRSAPGCEIVPKLNLEWLANDTTLFWGSARDIIKYDLITPITNINLDCWMSYCKNIHTTQAERDAMFARLRAMGYKKIGVNFTGLTGTNHPEIDYGDFNINTDDWSIRESSLNNLRKYTNLKDIYLYIDYPESTRKFMELDPDEQARIYTEVIYPAQMKYNIHYVYAIIQDFWGAGEIVTSPDGPYKGKTLLEITKDLLDKQYQ